MPDFGEVGHQEFERWKPSQVDDGENLATTERINISDQSEFNPNVGIDVSKLREAWKATEARRAEGGSEDQKRAAKMREKRLQLDAVQETQIREALHIEGVRDIEKTLQKLWPEGQNTVMKQGRGGDCYEISAFYALKESPDAFLQFSEHIFDRGDGNWHFEFFNEKTNDWEGVDIHEDQLGDGKKGMDGSLGDRLVERAYKSFISRQRTKEVGNTMQIQRVEVPQKETLWSKLTNKFGKAKPQYKERMPWEGGLPHRALFHFLGPEYQKSLAMGQENMVDALHQVAAYRGDASKQGYMLANVFTKADFPDAGKSDKKWWELGKKGKKTPDNVFARHAYSLGDVNFEAGTVTVINPHDTSKPKELSFQDFFQYFEGVSSVRKIDEGEIASNRTLYN